MKVGDVVKERCSGQVGLVIEKLSRAEADGNPNGDFTISYRYKVLFGTDEVFALNARSVEVISESR
tara:strand:- start:8605 stop:8802 length:198 start_codon:yes stop_codon:yes gene_type:complete